MKIKVSKVGICLVVAMFIVVLLISGVLATTDYRATTYSSVSSNPQYTKPGSLNSYSQQYQRP